jgi:hypothetical protein
MLRRLTPSVFKIAGQADVTVAQHADGIFDICCSAKSAGYNRVIA